MKHAGLKVVVIFESRDAAGKGGVIKRIIQPLTPPFARVIALGVPKESEDFAFYMKFIPGAMYWLGAANPAQGKFAILHTPNFNVDEPCLQTGTVAMASLLWEALLSIKTVHGVRPLGRQ